MGVLRFVYSLNVNYSICEVRKKDVEYSVNA